MTVSDKIECPECRGKGGSTARACPRCERRGWIEVVAEADTSALDELTRAREDVACEPLVTVEPTPLAPLRTRRKDQRRKRKGRRSISLRAMTYQRIRNAGVENVSGWLEDLIAEKLP